MFDAGIRGSLVEGGKVGLIIDDGTIDVWHGYGDDPDGTIDIEPLNDLLAVCLYEHFKYRFPNLVSFPTWQELVNRPIKQEIIDKLKLISLSRNFGFCPACPICKDLQV